MKRDEVKAPERAKSRRPAARAAEAPQRPPTIRDLDRGECDAILARNHIGRMAYSFKDRVDIEPLHYVFDDGWLIGRTSYGSKLAMLRHRPWVAFEVDEVDDLFDWRSVVVHGTFDVLTTDSSADESGRWEHAVEMLRRLVPATAAPGDPVPFRTVVFRIAIDAVTGREATTAGPGDV